MQIAIQSQETISPKTLLLKEPFIRLKVIEARDVYLIQGNRKDVGDLYARVAYETEGSERTSTVTRSSQPKWNNSMEFNYYTEDEQEGNIISISIYDEDPLGSDELVATQIIPLSYFKGKKKFGKPIAFWLRLHHINATERDEQIVIEAETSLYQDLNLPEFKEDIITKKEILSDNNVPKLSLILEIYDPVTINHFHVKITDLEEIKEEGVMECKVFLYVIKVIRNDGLEWEVKRRYSQIRQLKKVLSEFILEIGEIPFPGKSLLKYTSKLFSSLEKDYQKTSMERKDVLEQFLDKVASFDCSYHVPEFIKFFSTD